MSATCTLTVIWWAVVGVQPFGGEGLSAPGQQEDRSILYHITGTARQCAQYTTLTRQVRYPVNAQLKTTPRAVDRPDAMGVRIVRRYRHADEFATDLGAGRRSAYTGTDRRA